MMALFVELAHKVSKGMVDSAKEMPVLKTLALLESAVTILTHPLFTDVDPVLKDIEAMASIAFRLHVNKGHPLVLR